MTEQEIISHIFNPSVKSKAQEEGITPENAPLIAAFISTLGIKSMVFEIAKQKEFPSIEDEEELVVEIIKPEDNEDVEEIVEPVVEEVKEEPVLEVKPKRKSTKKVVEEPIELEVEVAREENED